ncbi:AAA family ATPase, partial [Leptospira wolffii]|uniref:AAA family ATPase n=1 Tax=Leptospira wolffii TaxID=409998 RepID=UPI0035CD1122
MKSIKSIEIKNSAFFKDLKVTFSNELNCIMGGRGTGKSTLMYFLKSALEPDAEQDSQISKILKNNLAGGQIVVEFQTEDGNIYTIEKTFNEIPQPNKLPGLEYIPIEKILSEIDCDIYEAMEIEGIGKNSIERLELIDKKNKSEIKEKEQELTKIQIDLDANAQAVKSQNKRLSQMDEILEQYKGAEEEFSSMKDEKQEGIGEEERKEFERADVIEKIRKEEKRYFAKSIESINNFISGVEREQREITESFSDLEFEVEKFHNKGPLKEGNELVLRAEKSIKEGVQNLSTDLFMIKQNLNLIFDKLIETHDIQQGEFIKLKQRFDTNREFIEKYHNLSKRVNEKETLLKDKEELIKKRDKLKSERSILIKDLNSKKQEIFNLRLNVVKNLNESFEKDIQITLTHAGITDEFQDRLKSALKGSGMRYNEIVPRIVENYSADEFAKAIHEKDAESLKNLIGIDDVRALALINALNETIEIYEIESIYCKDLP